jgi:YaaC-like Protein
VIITKLRVADQTDLTRKVWAGLRTFHNVERVATILLDEIANKNHSKSVKQNVKKQAEQIRYCLLQAREYYDASLAVSMATKPVLLYYSLMNLALAQILFTQSGDSSLDRAREQHRHHGLLFKFDGNRLSSDNLRDAASKLAAQRATRDTGEPFGTFELWLRSCRDTQICAQTTRTLIGNNLIRMEVIAEPPDHRPEIQFERMSLLECIQRLPTMQSFCLENGVGSNILRTTAVRYLDQPNRTGRFEIRIHPVDEVVFRRFIEYLRIKPDCVDRVSFLDLVNGGLLTFTESFMVDQWFPLSMSFPPAQIVFDDEILFWDQPQSLNEFGFFYVALFICGSYARYFPDRWMKDIEVDAPIVQSIEEIVHLAEQRVPLLTLSVLERNVVILRR